MTTPVFACADAPHIGLPGDEVQAIENLCGSPAKIAERIDGADQVVLLLHENSYERSDVQRALRSVEVDPLGVQILEVPAGISDTDLEITVSGLRNRAAAFSGSSPENHKPTTPREVSRRSVLRPPRPVYISAPKVDHKLCSAANGCHACVDICPEGAYRSHGGRIHFDKDICQPCGRCVTSCPTEAISDPSTTPSMLGQQVRALVDHASAPVGVRFVCSRGVPPPSAPAWHDIEVPCTGMVPGTWLLTALLMGAGSVTSSNCTDSGCSLGLDKHSQEAIDFARAALVSADFEPAAVPSLAGGPVCEPLTTKSLEFPFTHTGDVEAMLTLGAIAGADLDPIHDASNLGVVTIDPDSCTLCAQCAQTCPTSAIQASHVGEVVALSFDASGCSNCGQCTIACPEIRRGAIRVSGRVDLDTLGAGRQTMNEGAVLLCEACGDPIAPSSMMDRIGQLLGEDFDDTMSYLSRRCMNCRTLG